MSDASEMLFTQTDLILNACSQNEQAGAHFQFNADFRPFLSAFPSSVKTLWLSTEGMTTLYPVMVLTCRRGIFHRTLKAEQLIVSSWMSKGGLRRSVPCRRKEREGTQVVSFVGLGNICPAPSCDLRSLRPYRWKQRDNMVMSLRWYRAWNCKSPLEAAVFLRYQMEKKMWTWMKMFWLCWYYDGKFSEGLSDTSGDCVWASSDL